MAILVNENTRLLVQGITGREGTFHTQQAIAYGTKVVAGVTPGKGGSTVDGVTVLNTGTPSSVLPPLPGVTPATTLVP